MTENKIQIKLRGIDAEEVLEREVKKFGGSSHIILPQKHEGKTAIVIITDEI